MFGWFLGKRESSTYPTSRNKANDAIAGTCPHRHCWTLTNFSQGVAVRRDVRRQRFASIATAIYSVVKRFVADMGVPRTFHTDNGTEYSNSVFMNFCNDLGIRREFTAPYTP